VASLRKVLLDRRRSSSISVPTGPDRNRGAEARRHSVSLILRYKATLLLDKSIGLEILIPEGHIPNHKAMVVMLLDGVIERDLQVGRDGVLVARSGIGASVSLLLELELRSTIAVGLHSVAHPLPHVRVRIAQPGAFPLLLRGCVEESGHRSDHWMGTLMYWGIKEAKGTVDVEVMEASTDHHASLLRRDRIPRVGDTIRVSHHSIGFAFIELTHVTIRIVGHWWVVGAF
jgi:hypothetical protein